MSTKKINRVNRANRALLRACRVGDEAGARQALCRGANAVDVGMHLACMRHHRPVVDALLKAQPGSITFGLSGAAAGGHLDLVQDLLGLGARDVGSALQSACRVGHIPIITALLPHLRLPDDMVQFHVALSLAVRADQVTVVDTLLFQYGLPAYPHILFDAYRGGSVAVIVFLESHGFTYDRNEGDRYLGAACVSGRLAAVQHVLQKDPPQAPHDWNWPHAFCETVQGYKRDPQGKDHLAQVVAILVYLARCSGYPTSEPPATLNSVLHYVLGLPNPIPVSALLNAGVPLAWFPPRAVQRVVAYRTHRLQVLVQHCPLYDVLYRLVDAYAGYVQPPPGHPRGVDPPLRRSKRLKRSD